MVKRYFLETKTKFNSWIIWEFEKKIGIKIKDLDLTNHKGKILRGELLVRLKDLGGLRYSVFIDHRYTTF